MANRLGDSLSPYLRQHAQNPVDWWPWGDEAFAQARARDVPILLSVGYAACHWCHVMAHESFEHPVTAALMNERFVNIKVDREERPDIDAVYMQATQALTGRGGWPMTVFLDHDGRAFLAGTYFPPVAHGGLPAFTDVLEGVDHAWRRDRRRIEAAAAQVHDALSRELREEAGAADLPGLPDVVAAIDSLAAQFDAHAGGFGAAPKFPPSMVLEFLVRCDALTTATGTRDVRALDMAAATMTAMARGGMYDQLAGGFARYSVDAQWVVPHFEKMLYDNALLLRAYVHWWRATRDPLARRIVDGTARFLIDDLRTAQGGFASSLDADSEGREGAAYVWTPRQLAQVLGAEDGAWVAQLCEVTRAGTFERGTSVLQLRADPTDGRRWESARQRLRTARAGRPQPARDDKVVAAWNGLAIAALAEAGALMDEPDWIEAAVGCAHLLVGRHWDADRRRLARISLGESISTDAPGVLEDYADLAEGLLTLYQVTGDDQWFRTAADLLDVALTQFADGSGGFFDTAADGPALVRRPRDPSDGVTPSGASAAANALLTLAALSGAVEHQLAADSALARLAPLARSAPRFAGWTWAALTARIAGPVQVAIVLPEGDVPERDVPERDVPERDVPEGDVPEGEVPAGHVPAGDRAADPDHWHSALVQVALAATSPGLVVAVGNPEQSRVPLLVDRPAIDGLPTAYPCRAFVCDLPTTDPAALRAALER